MGKETKIANSVILVMGMTVITLLFSFVKEAVFANIYGASNITDAYTIAVQIPVTLFAMVSTAISNVALPYYSKKLNQEGPESASKYVSNLMTVITVLTLAIILILEVFAGAVIKLFAPGLAPEVEDLAKLLFRLVLPTILLTELVNINTTIQDVNKSFVLPLLGSVILNTTFVFFVCLLAKTGGIYAAVLGVIIGTILEFGYSLLLRRKYVKYHWVCNLSDKDMVASVKRSVPVFIGIGIEEINKTIDTMVSSFLEAGAVSMMNYASKLTSAISSLLIGGITKVSYPEFAESAAKNDHKRMADSFLYSIRVTILILFAVVVGGALLNKEIICVVYYRGAFNLDTVLGTAPIFTAYLVCLVFRALRQNASRVFYSYGDTRTPMKNTFAGLAMNTIMDLALFKTFGATGIAWATTASYITVSGLLTVKLKKTNNYIHFRTLIPLLMRVIIACLCMAGVIIAGRIYAQQLGLYDMTSFTSMALFTVLSIIVGAIVYFATLLLLKTKEVTMILHAILRRKNKA